MKISKNYLKKVVLEETKNALKEANLTAAAQAVIDRQKRRAAEKSEEAKKCQICKGTGVLGEDPETQDLCNSCQGTGFSVAEIARISKDEKEKEALAAKQKADAQRQAEIARCQCPKCDGHGQIEYFERDYDLGSTSAGFGTCDRCRGRGTIC